MRAFFLLLAAAACPVLLLRGQSPGPVVELPPYPVNEHLALRPPEAWRHAQLGDFEFLSNASESQTKDIAQRFGRFQALFRELFPPAKSLSQLPVAVVLCDKNGQFDELIPAGIKPAGNVATTSYFASDLDQAAIVLDLKARQVALQSPGISDYELLASGGSASTDDAGTEANNSGMVQVDPAERFNREYVHFQLSRFSPRLPAWAAEGFAQLYSHLSIGEDSFEFKGMDRALGSFFKQRRLMSLQQLFAVSYDSQEFLQPINGVFPAQSLAFVHLCLYGRKGQLQKPFAEFMRRSAKEPVTEALFREVFHEGYNSMEIALRNHVEGTNFRSGSLKLPVALPSVAIELRDATDAEVGRIKGDLLRLAGRAGAARAELLSPYLRGHSDARLLASIGFLDRAEQNPAVANKYFTLAANAKVGLPGPYLYLAESRLGEATADGQPPLTLAQAEALFQLLVLADHQAPARAEVYRLMAEVWLHTAAAPTPANLTALDPAVRVYSRDLELVLAVARAKRRAGLLAEANTLADLGLRQGSTGKMREDFLEVKSPRLGQP